MLFNCPCLIKNKGNIESELNIRSLVIITKYILKRDRQRFDSIEVYYIIVIKCNPIK